MNNGFSKSGKDNDHPIAIAYYNSARDEMLLRIREREIVFYVWLTILGTIFTISINNGNFLILLMLSLLSLGISFRISQHEILIGTLANYCKNEIGKVLSNYSDNIKHWDESESLREKQSRYVNSRSIINILLIIGPNIIALALNFNECFSTFSKLSYAWMVSLLCTLFSFYFLIKSFLERFRDALKK